jgi:hypothetical protein
LALKVAGSKLEAALAARAKLDPRECRLELQRTLAAKLGDIEPNRNPEATNHWTKLSAGANIEAITLNIEPGIIVPLLLMRPMNMPNRSLPVVVTVSEGGKARFLDGAAW